MKTENLIAWCKQKIAQCKNTPVTMGAGDAFMLKRIAERLEQYEELEADLIKKPTK